VPECHELGTRYQVGGAPPERSTKADFMDLSLPVRDIAVMRPLMLYLCRHGDTEWSPYRRLAGRTDIPLVARGEHNARELGERLRPVHFDAVRVSPLVRARRTAELAGLAGAAIVDERLLEMNFGHYEGQAVEEIRRERPGWTYLRDGCPGGESPEDIGSRADSLLADVTSQGGTVALVAHSVILRVITARYLGLPAGAGRNLMLSPGALCILGYDEVDESRAIDTWNDRAHLA
jgi:broad specificity phosphatase PhoE